MDYNIPFVLLYSAQQLLLLLYVPLQLMHLGEDQEEEDEEEQQQ